MKRVGCLLSATLCALLTLELVPLPARANSAQTWFSGVDAAGVIMADTESPIEVERELLTFDISEFPSNYYHTEEAFLAYSGRVTAAYTFYNPSEYTVTAKLLFPFGNIPHYSDGEYDENGNFRPFDDTEKFDITVNGEVVEREIRHTLSDIHGQFSLERDLALIHDGFADDEFFKPDLPVTHYLFKVVGVDTERYNAAVVAFDLPAWKGDYRVYFPEQDGGYRQQKDGDMRIHTSVGKNEREVELYVFGTPTIPEWKAYQDGSAEDKEEIAGGVELLNTQTTTFKEFALSYRWESAVSEYDWYNAVLFDFVYGGKEWVQPIVEGYRLQRHFERYLMRWYAYEITVNPKERVVNTVTAPLYPAIDLDYEPSIFTYTYLLSPAKTWKSFGEMEIVVNTPYYLTESSVAGFSKTEEGYVLKREGLPEGELEFTLSTGESPRKRASPYRMTETVVAFVAIGLLAVGGVTIILLLRGKRKRK